MSWIRRLDYEFHDNWSNPAYETYIKDNTWKIAHRYIKVYPFADNYGTTLRYVFFEKQIKSFEISPKVFEKTERLLEIFVVEFTIPESEDLIKFKVQMLCEEHLNEITAENILYSLFCNLFIREKIAPTTQFIRNKMYDIDITDPKFNAAEFFFPTYFKEIKNQHTLHKHA